MAQRLALHYYPGKSLLHRWDSRCKLAALSVVSIGLLHMQWAALALFSLALAAGVATARLPPLSFLRELKGWGMLLVLIFLLQAFVAARPGPDAPQPLCAILPRGHAMRAAALTCWRLGLILSYAVLFTSVSKPRDLQNGLTWLLRPLPFVPARRIAVMIGLTLRFLPLTLDQYAEIRAAVRSRLGDRRKGLLGRLKFLVLPLFRRSFIRSNEIAFALASRGYRENLAPCQPKIPFSHIASLALLILVVSSTLIFHY